KGFSCYASALTFLRPGIKIRAACGVYRRWRSNKAFLAVINIYPDISSKCFTRSVCHTRLY
ncbi:MAG: hypothetical protein KDK05_19180, partial [Candidatus Competibacteraceae bacterium]|nr:hypothetical protein [Candidatus Competibacteraceae bacterium]